MIAVTRRRPELGLLFWVAALGITGSVAVAAAEVAGFRPQQLVIPVTFVVIAFALHVFLAARGVRGDQLLLPIAAALTAIGLVLVQRLASNLLVQQLSWTLIAAGAFAGTILIPRDLTALSRFKWTWALLFLGIFPAMLYPATAEAFSPLIDLALLLVCGVIAYPVFAHVAARVDIWLHPFAEDVRFGIGYQLVQGLFALANGGLFGAGLGNGMPDRIPVVWSDFVFDAFAEETGFAGALALLTLSLLFLYRGMVIALRAPTPFLQPLAAGLSFSIALQTLVIVGGNARLLPLTAITLPFAA